MGVCRVDVLLLCVLGYCGSCWYAHENLVICVELKACNWNLINASGCDRQFVGQ